MDAAEKIGLLPGFGWLAGHSFTVTLIICLLITPIGHVLVGLVAESRLIPLAPSKQFLSFFPGDILLGFMTAGLLVLANRLPETAQWYNQSWWHTVVLLVVTTVATAMTYVEWKSGVYPTRALLSPSKLYHNFLLYAGYGYVIVATLVAVVSAARSWWLALVLLPGLLWAGLVVADNSLSSRAMNDKARHAHTEDWSPIWVMP